MKTLFILAAILLAFASTAQIAEENDVLILTDSNFDDAIKSNEFILVEFYAPWCGHCKKLAPELEKAAAVLKASDKNVPIAKVDATTEKQCSAPFEIKGFPTLKFFNNGNAIEYTGGRVEKDIVAWIQKRTGEVSQLIVDEAALAQFIETNKLSIVYFTENVTGENWDQYKSVAMNFDKIAFAHSTVESVAQSQKSALGNLVLFKDFDEKRNDYEGEFTTAAINTWVDQKKVATVMEFDDTAIELIFQKQKPTIFLFHNDTEESKVARSEFDLTASSLKEVEGSVKFCYVTPSNQHWQRLADYIGVNTAVVPASMIVKAGSEVEKFKFEGKFEQAEFKTFIEDFTNSKLSQHVKSEAVPETNDEPVKVIVGKNFEDIVINNDKDVLVKFYAPWCGHCKKLVPAWDEAAEKLEKNPNIVIAKCDSTQNEISAVTVKGFPTLKFWPGNNKKTPLDFNGDRTTEGILSWLKENTTHTWVELESNEAVTETATESSNETEDKPKKDDL